MNDFKMIQAEEFDFSPFRLIGKDWMLITAEKEDKVNTMTASWGGIGVIWNKNVAYIFVRKSRYTKEFIDDSDAFSLCFFEHQANAKMLSYMGTVSGRDEDKIEKMGLTVEHTEGVPFFDEASTVLICKKMCRQPIEPENFVSEEIKKAFYADEDYHDMYIGEITQILRK